MKRFIVGLLIFLIFGLTGCDLGNEDYKNYYSISSATLSDNIIPPSFDTNTIRAKLVYPPNAIKAGIEGSVILELFVDSNGYVKRIDIIKEDPAGWGFAKAAVKAFSDIKGEPATVDGEAVNARFRYPIKFKLI